MQSHIPLLKDQRVQVSHLEMDEIEVVLEAVDLVLADMEVEVLGVIDLALADIEAEVLVVIDLLWQK
jgi:hypothetical protein